MKQKHEFTKVTGVNLSQLAVLRGISPQACCKTIDEFSNNYGKLKELVEKLERMGNHERTIASIDRWMMLKFASEMTSRKTSLKERLIDFLNKELAKCDSTNPSEVMEVLEYAKLIQEYKDE